MSEHAFQTRVIKFLRSQGYYVVNNLGSACQRRGIADLTVCIKGRFIAVELKLGYNKPSHLQVYNLEAVTRCDGIGILLYDSGFDIFKDFIFNFKEDFKTEEFITMI